MPDKKTTRLIQNLFEQEQWKRLYKRFAEDDKLFARGEEIARILKAAAQNCDTDIEFENAVADCAAECSDYDLRAYLFFVFEMTRGSEVDETPFPSAGFCEKYLKKAQ